MQQNTMFYRTGLSIWGAISIGLCGLLVGAVWGVALDESVLLCAAVVGAIAAAWGAICFQLTPTGGVIMENKTTVNYAVIALHGWFAALISFVGAVVIVVQQLV